MIKFDEINKLIVFLAMVTAFSEDSQMNIMMNAPSSAGKSFIPLEIAKLFPSESVQDFHYVSPNAFFHDFAEYDEELDMKVIKLDRKILIFVDQPHPELLQRLRPLLSHDKKILTSKIVDKNQKGGNQTKTVSIQGYPTVIFCTAHTLMDAQESTRFILLSPQIHQDKLRASIELRIAREARSV